MTKLRKSKQQSAMEYLLTYSWSILLISLFLGILYSVGVFGISTNRLQGCVAQVGFLCSAPVLNATGVLNLTIGQASGSTYALTGVACTNSTNAPDSFSPVSPISLSSQLAKLNFKCPLTSKTIGTPFSGTIWIQYTTSSGGGTQTAQVGSVSTPVVTNAPTGTMCNLASVAVTGTIPIHYPGTIAFSPTGSYAYVADKWYYRVNKIFTSNSQVLGSLSFNPIYMLVSLDGAYIYASNTADVYTIAISNGIITNTISFNQPAAFALTPDGTTLYVPITNINTVSIISTATDQILGTITSNMIAYPQETAVSPNGAYLIVTPDASGVNFAIITTSNNVVVNKITTGENMCGIVFSKDSKYAYITSCASGTNHLFKITVSTGQISKTINTGDLPYGAAITPSGAYIYLTDANDGKVTILSTANDMVAKVITVGSQPLNIAISPDGSYVYVSDTVDTIVSVISNYGC